MDPIRGDESMAVRDDSDEYISRVVQSADEAFAIWSTEPPARRAALLSTMAEIVQNRYADIIHVAVQETGVSEADITAEFARMVDQLEMFAQIAGDASYRRTTHDAAGRNVQSFRIPIGPVAVFAAGNFPLAFGVVGTDTAAALAVGCSVVVKAHPGLPGTSRVCYDAMMEAIQALEAPSGLVAAVYGATPRVGRSLVLAPRTAAVAFTGSLAGGRALFDLANSRSCPIPVYAEMGSTNPVIISPQAAASAAEQLAREFIASLTHRAGQLCTNPGIVFVPIGPGGDAFVQEAAKCIRGHAPFTMLSERTAQNLRQRVARTGGTEGVRTIATGSTGEDVVSHPVNLFEVDGNAFGNDAELISEHFGPVSILVRYVDDRQLLDLVDQLPGSLAAAVHAVSGEEPLAIQLRERLSQKAGRLVFGGWPTGTPLSEATHHGGPFPATTAPAYTSVGHAAVDRFTRPLTLQGWPRELCPPEVGQATPQLGGSKRHLRNR